MKEKIANKNSKNPNENEVFSTSEATQKKERKMKATTKIDALNKLLKKEGKTMNTKKQRQYEQIKAHGENLLAIFPNATEKDPVTLCKKLRRLEAKAQAIALRLCNGPEYPGGYDEVDALTGAILEKVNAILGNTGKNPVPIFVNRDPRGYALKIDDVWIHNKQARIYSDWGGYGIIAPEITGD